MDEKTTNKSTLLKIFGIALLFRIVMYFISALIMAFQVGDGGTFTFSDFLSNWNKWDAPHYIDIAQRGYAGAVEACETCKAALLEKGVPESAMVNGQHLFLVFYPLYPWLMRFFTLFTADPRLAGMIISTLTYAVGCVYLYRLVCLDYSKTAARNTVILLSLFPFSFFIGGIMTEGLFLMISAATLYYIRSHKWWLAILFGIFATMTRTQGILLGIPAGIEWLLEYKPIEMFRNKDFSRLKGFIGRGLSLFLMLIGYGVYLLINWKTDGYPFSFLVYQKYHWNNGAALPFKTLDYVFRYAFSSEYYNLQTRFAMWIPEALIAIFSVIILVYGIKKLRAFHMAYGVAYSLLTFSSCWLISAGRYTVCCIPLFLVLALATEKHKWLMPVLTIGFAMLQMIYMTGYFNNLQIM